VGGESDRFEFELFKLTKDIRKQGFAIENSFVSYYSNSFQTTINCGLDPVSRQIYITPSDLQTINGFRYLRLVFSLGIKGEFYDEDLSMLTGG
jgi:hypothetical protein